MLWSSLQYRSRQTDYNTAMLYGSVGVRLKASAYAARHATRVRNLENLDGPSSSAEHRAEELEI